MAGSARSVLQFCCARLTWVMPSAQMAGSARSVLQVPSAGDRRREAPTFLFAYANDRYDDGRFLRNLAEERRRIKQALQSAGDQGRCKIVECSGATLSEVLDECQRHARSLALLHFAGHADAASLLFETMDGRAHTVSAAPFTQFLGGIKGLHLVFLNGCSTKAQVEALLAHGVRAVVATSSAVPDEIATELAGRFYRAIEGGAAIADAFHQATGAVTAAFGEGALQRVRAAGGHRDIDEIPMGEPARRPFPWELFGAPDALARPLMASGSTDRARCLVVIIATLEQFDADVIARVIAELQRVAGDLSLQITKIESGSVRLHVELSEEGARRLVESWQRLDLTTLCGFEVKVIEAVDDLRLREVVRRTFAGAAPGWGPAPDDARTLAAMSGGAAGASAPPGWSMAPPGQPHVCAMGPVPVARGSLPSLPLDAPAGSPAVSPRNSRRRRALLLGGLGAGALAAIGVVVALLDPAVLGSSRPPDGHVAVMAEPPSSRAPVPRPPSPPPSAAVPGSAGASEPLESECRRWEEARSWHELELCADRLMARAPERAVKLKIRAIEEARTAPWVAAVEAALRVKDLKRARSKLAQVWAESVEYSRLDREYEAAEAEAITELAAMLRRVRAPGCVQYEAQLARARLTRSPRVAAEAALRVPCRSPSRLPNARETDSSQIRGNERSP